MLLALGLPFAAQGRMDLRTANEDTHPAPFAPSALGSTAAPETAAPETAAPETAAPETAAPDAGFVHCQYIYPDPSIEESEEGEEPVRCGDC
jgi:hypothetical protein